MDYNTLSRALIKQLRDTFGTGVKIYTEPIQQGLTTPCFNITGQLDRFRRLGENVDLSVFFFVTYTPNSRDDKRSELNQIQNTFMTSKDWRHLGKLAHIHNLKARHNDETLVVSFSLSINARYEEELGEPIESIEGGVTID